MVIYLPTKSCMQCDIEHPPYNGHTVDPCQVSALIGTIFYIYTVLYMVSLHEVNNCGGEHRKCRHCHLKNGSAGNGMVHRVSGFLSSRPNWLPSPPHPQASVAPTGRRFKPPSPLRADFF